MPKRKVQDKKEFKSIQEMFDYPGLPLGRTFKGPEPAGCCGTGYRPAILHSKSLTETTEFKYAVGYEIHMKGGMMALMSGHNTHPSKHVCVAGRPKHTTVWFFKTPQGAKRKFAALCGERESDNARIARKHKRLRARAAKGDVWAMFDLGAI